MDRTARGGPVPTTDELATELAALRRRVDASESVLAIQELKARYGDLVDRRFARGRVVEDDRLAELAGAIAALFTEDGTWDGGPGLGSVLGRDAIAARLRTPTLAFSRHLFVAPRIEVDGDRASGRWNLLSPCNRPDGTAYWMCGYEDDTYTRVDGAWLHATMRLTTVFFAPVGSGWGPVLA
jgi:SnoaL-like domain